MIYKLLRHLTIRYAKQKIRISNKNLENLEDRVTKQLLSKLKTIVAKKCWKFFEDNSNKVLKEPVAIQQEIESLKSSSISLKNDFKFLNNKADSTIGSLSFVASEYHNLREKIGSITNDIKLDDPKLRECAHFILFLVTLHCRPHSSGFLWYWPFAYVPT